MAALVLAQFGLVLGGGVAASREASRALDDSFVFLADVSEERAVTFADASEQVATETAHLVERERPTLSQLVGTLYGAVTSRAQVEAVSVTFPNGNFAMLRRSTAYAGGFQSYVISGAQNGEPSRRSASFDTQMRLLEDSSTRVQFEPRDLGCYERATRAAGVVWSDIEISPITGQVQVSTCAAARDEEGEVVAVAAAYVALADLGESLNQLPGGSDGQVYLMTGGRLLLAGPDALSGLTGSLIANTGLPPRAVDVGVSSSALAASPDLDDAIGKDGEVMTVERGLGTEGLDWVLHVRAETAGVNEGFGRLQTVLNILVGGLLALSAGLTYLLWRMRAPLLTMRAVAERDPLTGLYNRRYLEVRAARLALAAHRSGRRLAVVMLDLDNFKALNDDLGHHAGDKALEDISTVLVAEIRAADVAVRWGGDEFLVVLSLGMDDDAFAAVERIRVRVETTLARRFQDRSDLGVTAGYAVSSAAMADIAGLIAAADAALVDGKWTGKGTTYAAVAPALALGEDRRA